jgi:pimeloyl-ACP methyl ester carboxylesterase
MGTAGHAIDNAGHNLVTDANIARLQGIPILFLSGGDDVVFTPDSTSMSYDDLRERFGTALYKRVVVGGYGHLDSWMSERSRHDVYPVVREHVEWCEGLVGDIVAT